VNKWDENCKRFTALADTKKDNGRWNREQMQFSQQYNVSEKILAALEDISQQKLQRLSEVQESKCIELLRSLSSDYKDEKTATHRECQGPVSGLSKIKGSVNGVTREKHDYSIAMVILAWAKVYLQNVSSTNDW
jgi:hypothetical protein